jgi:hypothetical protein
MQIPVLSGVYLSAGAPDVRLSYPVNMVPTPVPSGISQGYLRPGDGLVQVGSVPDGVSGVCRGAINWDGVLYVVIGANLYSISAVGAYTDLGSVGDGGPVRMVYSFDRLAIASSGSLYYYDGATLSQVTDPDLGVVLDVVFFDGYFCVTDGEFIAVTELADPTSVLPFKYGSSEIDPDPVVALLTIRNEQIAVNRYTIEMFDNVGGSNYPFQRVDGAQIMRGAIGPKAACVFEESVAFIGSGRNEQPGVYVGNNGSSQKISTVEVDRILATFTEQQLALAVLETRNDNAHSHLYMHLPDRTLVFDASASKAVEAAVWFTLTSSLVGFGQYRARYFVWAYDRWCLCDPGSARVGRADQTVSTHWGDAVRWEFATTFAYNEGKGAIVNAIELVAITGRSALGVDPTISTSYTTDGVQWSQPRTINAGTLGARAQRLCWRKQGFMRNYRAQRFQGTSDAHLAVMRLEVGLEGLAY